MVPSKFLAKEEPIGFSGDLVKLCSFLTEEFDFSTYSLICSYFALPIFFLYSEIILERNMAFTFSSISSGSIIYPLRIVSTDIYY